MASLRKIVDEADARDCLTEMVRSGHCLAEWARANGIDGRSLHAWRVNLVRWGSPQTPRMRARMPAKKTRALVELVPSVSPAGTAASKSRYVLEVGGARVEFGDDCSMATLRRVVEALRSC